ncbi:hypothetical protein [Ferrovum sp.]|uniref:hypothetical protein n=1 Tax=Ferrovum sp. TaxID=2609467 RepID=UPI002630F1A7|nr:hypothetical protein [Ferrovum sp.]
MNKLNLAKLRLVYLLSIVVYGMIFTHLFGLAGGFGATGAAILLAVMNGEIRERVALDLFAEEVSNLSATTISTFKAQSCAIDELQSQLQRQCQECEHNPLNYIETEKPTEKEAA